MSTEDLEKLEQAVATAKAAKSELHKEKMAFLKEHKLFGGKDHSTHEDKKIAKGWKDLKKRGDAVKANFEKAEAAYKEVKPKKARTVGVLTGKYDYPEDCTTSDDRKKFRTKMRAEAKKAEKAEAKGEKPAKEKKEKAAKKAEEPAKEKKAAKKAKDAPVTEEPKKKKKKKKSDLTD